MEMTIKTSKSIADYEKQLTRKLLLHRFNSGWVVVYPSDNPEHHFQLIKDADKITAINFEGDFSIAEIAYAKLKFNEV